MYGEIKAYRENMTCTVTRYIEKKSIPMIAWCPAFSNLG